MKMRKLSRPNVRMLLRCGNPLGCDKLRCGTSGRREHSPREAGSLHPGDDFNSQTEILSVFLTKGAWGEELAGTKQLPTQQFLIAHAFIMAARNIHGFFFYLFCVS
jgi:hypothetical protein